MQASPSAAGLAALVLFVSSPLLSSAASVSTSHPTAEPRAGWASTSTRAVSPIDAVDLGPAPAGMPLHVVVGLRMRDARGAHELVRRQNTPGDAFFHRYVTPQQFTAAFNPTGAQVSAVGAHLARYGFRDITADPNNLLVAGYATAGTVEWAFDTKIHLFRQTLGGRSRVVYANVEPARIPAELSRSVLGVLGLQNMPMATHLRKSSPRIQARIAAHVRDALRHAKRGVPSAAPTAQPCLLPAIDGDCSREYGPYDFKSAYDGLTGTTGSKTSIAIFAEGDVTQVVKDLATYQQTFGLSSFPVSVVQVGHSSSDTSGQDEFDLDTQSSTGIAGGVQHLYIYDTTSLSDADTALEFNAFVTQDKAAAGSASFGEPEALADADAAMLIDDQVFNQGTAQGQTFFASAGDNGAACPVIASTGVPFVPGVVGVCYPASSPDVVAVGGTSLLSDQNTSAYGGELGWQGTGGGVSAFEAPPAFQTAAIGTVFTGDGEFRAVPDVAMDADNNLSPAIVIVSGSAEGVGGTSLSSPLSLGVWSRLLSAHPGAFGTKKYGYGAPAFYYEWSQFPIPTPPPVPSGPPGFGTSPVGGFHDVYFGFNGLYTGLPGYDLMTGLGTFDIGVQLQDIDLPGAP